MQGVPLTIEQQNALKAIIWLFAAITGAVTIGLGTIFCCLFIASGGATVVTVFIAICTILALSSLSLLVWRIYSIALDLRDGVAQVRHARLKRTFSSKRTPKNYYAEFFDTPGTLQFSREVWETLQPEGEYLVIYSPRSRLGWAAESVSETFGLD
ncbi:MAG: hypothetical protein SNJ69_06290 [Chloroflexaceae bacterium]